MNAAEAVDTEFWLGLRLSDRAWWSGLYTDWIDGLYEGGRHAAVRGGAAVADVYAPAVARACGVNLVRRSLAVVIGRSPYSSQISHLYFIDRRGHALLYWQHT